MTEFSRGENDARLAYVHYPDERAECFQKASTEKRSIPLGDTYGNVAIPYDGLVTSDGTRLDPYLMRPSLTAVYNFGESLQGAEFPHEDVVGMLSKKYASDLEFLAIIHVMSKYDPHAEIERLRLTISGEGWSDSRKYPSQLHEILSDEALSLWVRLKWRYEITKSASEIIVAKLVRLDVGQNHEMMIPVVKNHDETIEIPLSKDLALDEPWLYIEESDYRDI